MITVTGPVWLWSEGKGSWHFFTIPADEAVEIRLESAASGIRRGFGSVQVEATINGVAWQHLDLPAEIGRLHPADQGRRPPTREYRGG